MSGFESDPDFEEMDRIARERFDARNTTTGSTGQTGMSNTNTSTTAGASLTQKDLDREAARGTGRTERERYNQAQESPETANQTRKSDETLASLQAGMNYK